MAKSMDYDVREITENFITEAVSKEISLELIGFNPDKTIRRL